MKKLYVLRIVIGVLLIGVTASLNFSSDTGKAEKTSSRPNIIFLIADDWSWPHASGYGDKVVKTPVFDAVAKEGILFTQAYCVAPSCSPSRASILTGQEPHRLEEAANLWSILSKKFVTYTGLLEQAGYAVGSTRKGWGPGDYQGGGYAHNPAGKAYTDFNEFFSQVKPGQPFCFWFGSHDPHRPYESGSGAEAGLSAKDVNVPAFLPNVPEVQNDILDYYYEIERFDREVGNILDQVKKAGLSENTMVVITGDNGMCFPRAKANLYDGGTHVPLAIRWPATIKGGRIYKEFVSFIDFAPTFLEAAGIKVSKEMTGKSIMPVLAGSQEALRDKVFLERERHALVRKGDLGYPCRGVRTKDFLYIRNLHPDRWPAGDPEKYVDVGPFGDVSNSPSKYYILGHRAEPAVAPYSKWAFEKRPAEELYDLSKDPDQLNNVADDPVYKQTIQKLRKQVDAWMTETADPRAGNKNYTLFDEYDYNSRKQKSK